MKNLKEHLIPALVLILFVLAMNSGQFLKKSFTEKDNVNDSLTKMEEAIINEQWQQADIDLNKLQEAWTIVQKRIQFVTEKDVLEAIDVNLSRLQGAITSHDKTTAIIELSEIKLLWEELGT